MSGNDYRDDGELRGAVTVHALAKLMSIVRKCRHVKT